MIRNMVLLALLLCSSYQAQADAVVLDDLSSEFTYFSKDPSTNRLVPTDAFMKAICSPDQPEIYIEHSKAFLEGINSFATELDSPFQTIEAILDSDVYTSFQKLKMEVANQNPTVENLKKAVQNFEISMRNSAEAKTQSSSVWILKILTRYASEQTLQTIQSAPADSFNIRLESIVSYSYLTEEDRLYTIFKFLQKNKYYFPVQPNMAISEEINQLPSLDTPKPDLFHRMIRQAYKVAKNDRAQVRVLKESYATGPYDLEGANEVENIIQQLISWGQNPQSQICGQGNKTPLPLMDWCVAHDWKFVEALEKTAIQANETSELMKSGKADPIVRGVVGIEGESCKIEGYYHLIKKSEQEVELTTSGNLLVNKNNTTQKTRFHEMDLITALETKTPNFNLEKKPPKSF